MAFTPQFLDEIRTRLSCSEVIGRRVRLIRKGRESSGLCPFHNEKSPSFTVNDDKGFFHCFAAETNVITRDGVKAISSLAGKRAVVLTRGGQWVSAPFKAYGRQKLYRIDLSRNGVRKSVFATSGHRWFVRGRGSAIITTELRRGHRLEAVLPEARKRWTLDAKGVQHGIMFGDGTVQRKGRSGYGTVNLHGDKADDLAKWFSAYRPTQRFRENGIEYLRVYGGRDFGHMKALPALEESDEYLLGFIAGYLATDGHVAKDGTVMLHCKDPAVLSWVRDAATRLGIGTFSVTAQERAGYLAAAEPIHRIHFVGSTLHPDMVLRREARKRFKSTSKVFERLRWAVVSVAETDRMEEVYCAEVPEHHAFALEDNILTGNCFGCGAHGDVIGFTMRIDNLSFPEAVEKLAGEAGLEMPRFTPQERERAQRQQTLHDVVEAACAWFEQQLQAPGGRPGLDYLRGRGLSAETIQRFRLGYAPDGRSALKAALKAQGIGEALMLEAGLIVKPDDGRDSFDFFRGRVMFPILDRRGRVIAFGGRIIGDGQPKYLNSRDTPLFDKGRNLYALDKARVGVAGGPSQNQSGGKAPAELIVVEGYMDVIALHEAGFTGAVAPLGTAITEAQIEALWKLAPEPIICLDGDAAGQRAALRAAERVMPLLKPGFSLRFAVLPAGDDPDSLIRRSGGQLMSDVLAHARPLVDIVWDAEAAGRPLDTPERRAGLERRLKERVALIADRSVQTQYFNLLVREKLWTAFRPQRFGRRPEAPALRYSGLVTPREAEILVATLINHPSLAHDYCETLAGLTIDTPALDQILKEILVFAGRAELDSEGLKSHLMAAGLAAAMAGLMQPTLYKLWSFAGPTAELEAARSGLEHLLGRFHERELEAEVRSLEGEVSDEGQTRLQGLQEQLRHTGLRGSSLDDDIGTPAGRPTTPAASGSGH
jgi:DNA primase catalytic core